jgi:hypothetical protein
MKSNADKMLDKTRLSFGKHKGLCPEEIAKVDPGYVLWLYNNVEPKRCSKELALDCEDAVNDADDPDRYDAHEW